MNNNNADAQREMEQRALRNVRGLVDKIESSDEIDARKQKRVLLAVLAVVVVVAVVAALVMSGRKPPEAPIDASKLPPLKGGPQK